jgi:hypothetical protein
MSSEVFGETSSLAHRTVKTYNSAVTCPLCRTRKARRACPALGHDICSVCCATKRVTEIACPTNCVYLETAQRHPAAATKRQQERDLAVLLKTLGHVSEGQLELFFLIQTWVLRFKPRDFTGVVDADLADAATALAASFETASRGVIYEHQTHAPVAEQLRRELQAFLADVGRGGGPRFEAQAAEVLRGIARGASREAEGIGAGDQDYLSLVARVLRERPPTPASRSRIVLS